MHGEYSTLTKRIKQLPASLPALLLDICQRVRRESATFEGINLVDTFLNALCVTGPSGLYEADLGDMLADVGTHSKGSRAPSESDQSTPVQVAERESHRVPAALIAQVKRELRPFLTFTSFGTIICRSWEIGQVLKQELFGEKDSEGRMNKEKEWHGYFADFYEYKGTSNSYICRELPYHLHMIRAYERLYRFLTQDRRAFLVNPYIRSQHLRHLLCPMQVNVGNVGSGGRPNDPTVALFCMRCAHSPNKFAPVGGGLCKDVCWLCGGYGDSRCVEPLRLCHMHAGPFQRCFTCNGAVPPVGPTFPVRACAQCMFLVAPTGTPRKCCAIVRLQTDPAFHFMTRSSIPYL